MLYLINWMYCEGGVRNRLLRRRAEAKITNLFPKPAPSANDERLAALLANTTTILSLYDRDFRLTHCAQKFTDIYGKVAAPGVPLWDFYPSVLDEGVLGKFRDVLESGLPTSIDLQSLQGGLRRSALVFAIAGGLAILESEEFRDGSRTEADEQEHVLLLHQATHDALTGLQNRRQFGERLQEALSTVDRDHGKGRIAADRPR